MKLRLQVLLTSTLLLVLRLGGGKAFISESLHSTADQATSTNKLSTDLVNVTLVLLQEVEDLNKTISFSIDPFLENIDVVVGHPIQLPNVFFPAGMAYNYSIINDGTAMLYHFPNPTPENLWSFNVSSGYPGWYTEVKGQSGIDVDSALYVKSDNKTQAYKEINGFPVIGDVLTIFLGPYNTSSFPNFVFNGNLTQVLVRSAGNGSVLAICNLTVQSDDPSGYYYRTDFTVPSGAFYFEGMGVGNTGFLLQRITLYAIQQRVITPSSIRINIVPDQLNMYPDTSTYISLNISNLGGQGQLIRIVPFIVSQYVSISEIVPSGIFLLSNNTSVNASATIHLSGGPNKYPIGVRFQIEKNETVKISNFFFLAMQELEVYPPECKILSSSFNTTCSGVMDQFCKNLTWFAEMSVFERDIRGVNLSETHTGSGSVYITLNNVTNEMNETTRINATGSCCLESVNLTAVNFLHQSNNCQLERTPAPSPSPAPPTGLPIGAIVGIAVGAAVLAVILALFLFKLVQRRSDSPYEDLDKR